MTIEFHTPAREVQEWVIDDIKKKLTEFHKIDKEISRAEVNFRKHPIAFDGEYVCEINLAVFGNSIMVQRTGDSYTEASREVLKELSKIVDEQIQKQKELPDDIYSSVKV